MCACVCVLHTIISTCIQPGPLESMGPLGTCLWKSPERGFPGGSTEGLGRYYASTPESILPALFLVKGSPKLEAGTWLPTW